MINKCASAEKGNNMSHIPYYGEDETTPNSKDTKGVK